MSKLWTLAAALFLTLLAMTSMQWRMEFPLVTSSTFVFEYDGELSDADLMNRTCLDELEALAAQRSSSVAWLEGSLLLPVGEKRLVLELTDEPADEVLWYGLYVDGELVAEASREDGSLEIVEGSARARLEASVDPLLDRRFRYECLRVDGIDFNATECPPVAFLAWSSLRSLVRSGAR